MANDETVFREVDQELSDERQLNFIRQNGPFMLGASVLIVLFVAGLQIYNGQKSSAANTASIEFNTAATTFEDDRAAGINAYESITNTQTGGYQVLADLRLAGAFAADGDRAKALEHYRKVYNTGSIPKSLKNFARVRAAYLSLDEGRDAVLADLGELVEADTALGIYAREAAGIAALNDGDFETAKSTFEQLSINFSAPIAIRQRAEELAALSSAAKAGVDISTDIGIDDLSKVLGDLNAEATGDAAGSADEHEGEHVDGDHSQDDGHDHGSAQEIENAAGSEAPGSVGDIVEDIEEGASGLVEKVEGSISDAVSATEGATLEAVGDKLEEAKQGAASKIENAVQSVDETINENSSGAIEPTEPN